MLSEVVLQHLDKAGEQGARRTIYLRYVDDIKILAKTEKDLRAKLIKLDIASKEIGLFPQTSKINIRKVRDPEDEVKSVSRPPEPSLVPFINQTKLTARILEICRRGRVASSHSTRFKYLLANVVPSHRLNGRLINVLQSHPEYAPQIASYISRYKKIPTGFAADIKSYLDDQELYHSVLATILDACLGRLPSPYDHDIGRAASRRLLHPKVGALPLQPTYKASLIACALSSGSLTFAQYEGMVATEPDWWVKKRLASILEFSTFGVESYENFLNVRMREDGSEVARICAARLVEGSHKLANPYGTVETTAKHILRAAKIIRVVGAPDSRIPEIIAYVLERRCVIYDWKALFGSGHKHAERMMIMIKRDREANIEKFLVHLDSWCDLLLSEIYKRQKPGKTYPNYGSALRDPTLIALLPNAIPALEALHAARLESSVAHPRSLKTGKPTRRLKHHDFYKIRRQLVWALDEIEHIIIP